jgi:P4 family phage/plasmid primase-like protien
MIPSDIPYNKPNEAWQTNVQKEAELDRKNPVYEILHKIYPAYADFLDYDENEKPYPFKPAKVAIWLQQNENFKTDLSTGILYFYDGKSWIPNAEPYLECIVSKILDKENKRHYFTDILHDLKGLTYDKIEFSFKIAVQNGLLDVETQTFTDFNENEMAFHEINVKYDPAAECPNFEEFMRQVVNPDDLATIHEWSGFLLLPDYRFHKLLWVHGAGRNGKGVWQRTMEAILGESNVSSIGLEEFDGNHRFALENLYGKLFNPCSEPNTNRILQTALLKKATGQDTIEAEIKGKQARLQFRNYSKITVLANKFPKINDSTTAFKERRLFIKFPNEFTGKDQIQNIERNWLTINDEKSGILNWMLVGLKRLLEQGYFTESKTQQETEIEFFRASDTVSAFLTEMAIFDKNRVTTRSEAFESYKKYCDVLCLDSEPEKKFSQRLSDAPKIKTCYVRIPKQERAWKGLGLKNIDDDGKITENATLATLATGKGSLGLTQNTENSLDSKVEENRSTPPSVATVATVAKTEEENETEGYHQIVCVFCGKPLMDLDWTSDDFTWGKKAHNQCYDAKKSELAAQDREG